MTFKPRRATRDPSFRPGQTPGTGTLRDAGILSYDCPFCPGLPAGASCQGAGPRFGADDALADLVTHYLCHRVDQMRRGEDVSCPCCDAPLRRSLRPDGPDDAQALELLRSKSGRASPAGFLQLELSHLLRGSLNIPEIPERADDRNYDMNFLYSRKHPLLVPLWASVKERFEVDDRGRLCHAAPAPIE